MGTGTLTPTELRNALSSTGSSGQSRACQRTFDQDALEGLIAASDLYGEGYVDVDEFLAAMLANSNYAKTKDAVSALGCYALVGARLVRASCDRCAV